MKIAFFETNNWEEKILKKNFPQDELFFSNKKIDETEIPERTDFDILSVFVGSRLTEEMFARLPSLKFIATRSTGFDHIELSSAKIRGIPVAYVPGYGDNTVAEFTFGLILNLTRKMYQAIDQIKENCSFDLSNLEGMDLKGKTLGVVGTGRIGKEMIKIAKGFSMQVIAYDPYPDLSFQKDMSFEYMTFDELLSKADIITLHCPYNPSTRHLINKDNIGFIKKGAYLINTARGQIVETEALVNALGKEILAGAGLDVLEEEGELKDELNFLATGHPKEEELKTLLYDHALINMPNVLITPHNAFNSQEALERILKTTIENIKSFQEEKSINLVPEQ